MSVCVKHFSDTHKWPCDLMTAEFIQAATSFVINGGIGLAIPMPKKHSSMNSYNIHTCRTSKRATSPTCVMLGAESKFPIWFQCSVIDKHLDADTNYIITKSTYFNWYILYNWCEIRFNMDDKIHSKVDKCMT